MSTAILTTQVQTRIDSPALVYSSGTLQAVQVLQLAVDTVGLTLDLTNIISVHTSMTTAIDINTSDDDLTALNAASIALGITNKRVSGIPVNGVSPINSNGVLYNAIDGSVWIKSGFIEGDSGLYPDATQNGVTDASYTGISFDASAQTASPRGGHISDDGTKVYLASDGGTSFIFQYALTTPFDISTAVYDNKSFAYATQGASAADVHLTADGTKMTLTTGSNSSIHQYALSTPFDVTTAVFIAGTTLVLSPMGVTFSFKPDGMALLTSQSTNVYEVPLSAAFDLSTAGALITHDVSGTSNVSGMAYAKFSVDGSKLFIVCQVLVSFSHEIQVWKLSTPFDISTATLIPNSEIIINTETNTQFDGFFMGAGDTTMYFVTAGIDTIFQYAPFGGVGLIDASVDTDTNLPIYLRVK